MPVVEVLENILGSIHRGKEDEEYFVLQSYKLQHAIRFR